MARTFRFGVSVRRAGSAEEWAAKARRAEELGFDAFLVPDHFGDQLATSPAIVAAAEATSSMRVGSLVYDNDFRHPALLAKEAATIDLLSGGRLELGLGAGWLRSEYERAGIPFDRGAVRVERLEEAVAVVKGLFGEGPFSFSGRHYTVSELEGRPRPLQRPHPPILVGGGGRRLLGLAGREADIVSFVPSAGDGELSLEQLERKIAWVREAAGPRFASIELGVLVVDVAPKGRRTHGAQVLAGAAGDIEQTLLARRERFGVSYVCVFEDGMEAIAPVVERLAGV